MKRIDMDTTLNVLFALIMCVLIIIGCMIIVGIYHDFYKIPTTSEEGAGGKHEIAEPAPLTEAEFELLQETLRIGGRVEELETALRVHIEIGHQKTGSKE